MTRQSWRTRSPHRAKHGLYSRDGRRKYLTGEERRAFLEAAAGEDRATHTFCLTLAYTGCRISEALALSRSSVQSGANLIAIRTLKRRGEVAVREIPVPDWLVRLLLEGRERDHPDAPLWPFGRTFAWRQVKAIMGKAGISGLQACPRGLRHGFAATAMFSGVQLTLIQKWLGHATIAATLIYTDLVGPEERALVRRMWQAAEPRELTGEPMRYCPGCGGLLPGIGDGTEFHSSS